MKDIFVVGIAGGSGSGKTTLANQLAERLGNDATILTHDCYYRRHDDLTYEERTHLNYDHPDSYETELMAQHLAALLRGESIPCPVYDFTVHNRKDETVLVEPSRVIIVEGILILSDAALRGLMDLKVYVDADADVRILRRMQRDVRERGRTVESVTEQYLATVKPMHDKYVEPCKHYADVIVPTDGEANPEAAVELLVSCIHSMLA